MPRPNMRGQFLHLQEPFDRELSELFKIAYEIPLGLVQIASQDVGNAYGTADHCLFVSNTIKTTAATSNPFVEVDNRKTLALSTATVGVSQILTGGSTIFNWCRAANGLTGTFYIRWNSGGGSDSRPMRAPYDGVFTAIQCFGAGSIASASSALVLEVNGSDAKTLAFGVGNTSLSWEGSVSISKGQTFDIRFDMAGTDYQDSPDVMVAFAQTAR